MSVARASARLRRADLGWFDLERYASLAEFQPWEWAATLKGRRHLRERLRAEVENVPAPLPEHWDISEFGSTPFRNHPPTATEAMAMVAIRMAAHGLRDCFGPVDGQSIPPGPPTLAGMWAVTMTLMSGRIPGQCIDDVAEQSVVAELTMRDICAQYADFRHASGMDDAWHALVVERLRGGARPWVKVTQEEQVRQLVDARRGGYAPEPYADEVPFTLTVSQFARGVRPSPYRAPDETRWLNVDLGASDERILSDMAAWLAARRVEQRARAPKGLSDSLAARWIAHGVLPYIDLQLFAELTGRTLGDALAGDLIFPDAEFDRAEKIRKTVRGLSEELLDPSFLNALELQREWS